MSMICCDQCGAFIDSDDDPECFLENPDAVYCESCREDLIEPEAVDGTNI